MLIDRRLASHFDWALFGLTLCLGILGIVTIYSATYSSEHPQFGGIAARQLYWFLVGLGGMIVFFSVDYHHIDRIAYPFYGIIVVLLVLVDVVGHVGGGSQRWLHLGLFSIQPSEASKLAIVWLLARFLKYDEPPQGYRLRDLLVPAAMASPAIILVLVQPDLGTAVILSLILISVLLMAGLRLRSFAWLVAAGLVFFPVAWNFLKAYQKQRIWTFLNPDLDPLGAGYHVIQSKIAVGSGRLFGKGFLNGTQNRLDFLPAQHTDFVFSVFAEEWGFIGGLLLLLLYFGLLYCALQVVSKAKDRFGAILAFGMTAILFWQIVINISMVTGILPVVGITLPLVSYGGSSLVTTMIAIGLLINVSMRRYTF